ncbi:imidazole glycerol phosphate synthase HisHF [Piedraia hortae CBS 480.64]|uniref:Imidazole glycerol phosphate synthase hisHF n=1 Tax=Piedraia hortae CBS 480.64 TaxID=1314780 RepID=A0A6A7C6V8_9PEZI|nr:imidazole glycerol phosphate synthase HisHF [Piedraia hortae CBS 480.64]
MPTVHLLDYAAGNIRSLVNAIEKLGWEVEWIKSPKDVPKAEKLILPGVGHFGHCLSQFTQAGYVEPVKAHITSGKPFMGICVGLQALFEGSTEDPSVPGLGLVKGTLQHFTNTDKSVPHIGWNSATSSTPLYGLRPSSKYYYVHSYFAPYHPGTLESQGWGIATATYGTETFIGAISKSNILATQFHPEKSGVAGLRVLKSFLSGTPNPSNPPNPQFVPRGLTNRIIACLDVRTNDSGDLVVTKGDQYDVREKNPTASIRNLGKPISKAQEYYHQGADEITFLNITSFRETPLRDLPMLTILRQTAATTFVPLTIGGGIRDTFDPETSRTVPALEVAKLYFQSGADKVSIGSDAVDAAEGYYAAGGRLSGKTAIEMISSAYGAQAVVVSIDPKRVWVASPDETEHFVIPSEKKGPNGEGFVWFACTAKGGRETRDLDVVQLAEAVEAMGAGEILLNCIDRDGTNEGFDLELLRLVKGRVRIPVIASSGAGRPEHFKEVFDRTGVDAALGAGIFHRGEYTVGDVKRYLEGEGLVVRRVEDEDDL